MNTIKTLEFNCPCCGEKINIVIKENGDYEVSVPFLLSDCKSDNLSQPQYDFGNFNEIGGENNESR